MVRHAQHLALLGFVRHSDNHEGPLIQPGEAKAFVAAEAFGRVGTEVLIEWTPEGEEERRISN
jgi:hypothetical protein